MIDPDRIALRTARVSSTLVLSIVLSVIAPGLATAAVFLPLGLGGGTYQRSVAKSVSASGAVVVGIYDDSPQLSRRAFVWTPGTGVVELFGPGDPADETRAFAVSNDGLSIVGDYYNATVNGLPLLWELIGGISVTTLDYDTGGTHLHTVPVALSADASVLAGPHLTSYTTTPRLSYPSRWIGGVITPLPDEMVAPPVGPPSLLTPQNVAGVSDDGVYVTGDGTTEDNLGWVWRWSEAGGYELLPHLALGAFWVNATAISAAGDAVVGNARVGSEYVAYLWREGSGAQLLGLLDPGDDWSEAASTTEHGDVVVGTSGTDLGFEGFIWDDMNGMRDLRTVFLQAGMPVGDWTDLWPTDISPDGSTIVGRGLNADGDIEAWVAYVPEPGLAHALVPGVLLLGALRRRRYAGR